MEKKTAYKDINPEILQVIGYVVVVADNIEHYLEEVILNIVQEQTGGNYQSMDTKPVSQLIAKFAHLADNFAFGKWRNAIEFWRKVATESFIVEIRSSMVNPPFTTRKI